MCLNWQFCQQLYRKQYGVSIQIHLQCRIMNNVQYQMWLYSLSSRYIYRSSSSERYTYMAWKLFSNSNEKELSKKNKAVHFKQTHKVYSDRHLQQTAQRDNVQHSPQTEYSKVSDTDRKFLCNFKHPIEWKTALIHEYWPETGEVLILRDWQQCLQHS